jgi:hypothetical protein
MARRRELAARQLSGNSFEAGPQAREEIMDPVIIGAIVGAMIGFSVVWWLSGRRKRGEEVTETA